VATLACGCQGPRLEIQAEPTSSRVLVDGEVQASASVGGPVRYYGEIEVAAIPDADARPSPRPARSKVRVDPPAPLLLFPIDFFVEHGLALFFDDPIHRATLTLEPRTDVPATGDEPEQIDAFRARARDAARAR
jgi:hypothetical protein